MMVLKSDWSNYQVVLIAEDNFITLQSVKFRNGSVI